MTGIVLNGERMLMRNKEILSTDLDGEIGMLHIESGNYYSLDHVSSEIWNLLEEPLEVRQLIDRLLELYDIDEETCTQQTLEFLTTMHELGLISIHK